MSVSTSPMTKVSALRDRAAGRTAAPAPRRGRPDRNVFKPRLWPVINYRLNWLHGKWVQFASIRSRIIRPDIPNRQGAYILATTHISHLEPFIASVAQRRKIDWMTRIEFFRYKVFAVALEWLDAFPVNRQGCPVSTIRTSIARLRQGRIIGICPEGGCAKGQLSVMRGGPIKRGAALLAQRTGAPIIPCAILGADKLNCVKPWIPYKRGRLWIAYGQPIVPDLHATNRKAERERISRLLTESFQSLYAEMLATFNLSDSDVP